jgi:hypothetical protein
MSKLSQIRAGIVAMIESITAANGYITTIAPTHIFANKEDPTQTTRTPANYPKVLIAFTEQEYSYESNRRLVYDSHWEIAFAMFEERLYDGTVNGKTSVEQADAILEDIELAISRNQTLGGAADFAMIESVVTDAGMTYPESILLVNLMVKYRQQMQA